MKGGFFFKINQKQFDNWRKDYRCPPDESNVDCGAMVLSFLGIPYDIAEKLQIMSHDKGQLTMPQLRDALNLLPYSEFENSPNIEDVTTYDYDNINDMMSFLTNYLPSEYAVIVLGIKKKASFEGATRGHFFILYKNEFGNIYVLDPQQSILYTYPEEINNYLSKFDDGFFVLIGKTQDGKFSKFNNLYKQLPSNMLVRKSKERRNKGTLKRLQKTPKRKVNIKRLEKNSDNLKSMLSRRIGGKKRKTNKNRKSSKKNKHGKTSKTSRNRKHGKTSKK